MAMQGLYGGPSYHYSYQELDPTERQYLQEQALQESQQASGFLGQSNFQPKQSFSQSHWQRERGRLASGLGFATVPEEEMVQFQQTDFQGGYSRKADAALQSWKMEGSLKQESQSGAALLSSNTSAINLKEFLSKRGEKNLQGIHQLAAQGDTNGVMNYMKQYGPNALINELDTNGCTPLMYAALAESRSTIEMLLSFSAKREQRDLEGRTAVHYAAFFGKHRALKFLITAAADWAPMDNFGRTPLHWACFSKTTQTLAFLLKHSQVVMGSRDPRDHEDMTPLHIAAHFCRPRHIALLHEAECDFTAVDCELKTALHWTASNPDSSCAQVLVELCPSLLNKQDGNNSTILHCAAQKGATHLVATLLEFEGIDVNVKDANERTALHWASAGNHSAIMTLLLSSNALDSCIDASGLTALHYCVRNQSASSVEPFVSLRDLTHLPSNEGRTPLMEAAAIDFPEAVQLLLTHRVVLKTIDSKDPQGMSSLHLAADCGSKESVHALLSKGANASLLDTAKRTPLFLATQNGHGECMQLLISKGCEVDLFDDEGQTPLHRAVMLSQLEAVQVLAMNGADLNIKDPSGNTAMHVAAYSGSNAILTTLLSQSANPNLQNANGVSAVHLAAMEGHAETLSILIVHRAYVNFVDFSEERYTPVDYARLHGHTLCVEMLTEAGGVTTEDIRNVAALTIQTAFRGYRARIFRSELALKSRAVTCLTKYFRGHLQRNKFLSMRQRHHAAIKIQSFYRGYVERVRFQIKLFQFREHERQWKLIENFSKLVQQGHERGALKTFNRNEDLLPEMESDYGSTAIDLERERKTRLETAMRMRVIYEEKQKKWAEFRAAEAQRRTDKANAREINRLNSIIQDSKARREYTHSKFQQSLSVRTYHQAALVIQRAYRKTVQSRAKRAHALRQQRAVVEMVRERAALVIQRFWKLHRQQKLYRAMRFMSIMSGPVVAVSRRVESPPGVRSYQRGISITGSPKRKMHQTLPSAFHVFRPLTRDLLQGSGLTQDPFPEHGMLRAVPDDHTSSLSPPPRRGGGGMDTKGRGMHLALPELMKKPASKPDSSLSAQKAVKLPDIVTP